MTEEADESNDRNRTSPASSSLPAGLAAVVAIAVAELAVATGGPSGLVERLLALAFVGLGAVALGLLVGGPLMGLAGLIRRSLRQSQWTSVLLSGLGVVWLFHRLAPPRLLSPQGVLCVMLAAVAGVAGLWICESLLRRVSSLSRALPWSLLLLVSGAAFLFLGPDRKRAPPPSVAVARTAPCVLLVTIDTLRADRLPSYGYAGGSTPVLDQLAKEGALFRSVLSQSHLTGPSHLTILSGLHPDSHGVYDNASPVPPAVETIAGLARLKGMETAAFVGAWPVGSGALEAVERFRWADDDMREFRVLPAAVYETTPGRVLARLLSRLGLDQRRSERPSGEVNRAARAWFEQSSDRPFFVWTHYYDPHLPYESPLRFRQELADAPDWYSDPRVDQRVVRELDSTEEMRDAAHVLGALYDAEVSYSDESLGDLIEMARSRAGVRPLWIFVTADHGESFGEHGNYYWRDLYQPTVHVPLIVRPPEALAQPAVVDDVAGLVDVAPTIADVIGAKWSEPVDGASLLPLLAGDAVDGSVPVRSAVFMNMIRRVRRERRQTAVREGRYKLIHRVPGWGAVDTEYLSEELELYDLELDPAELFNIAGENPEVVARLLALSPKPISSQVLAPGELTPDQVRRLRALGYL